MMMDARSPARKAAVLQRFGQRLGACRELAIGQPMIFSFAVRFDQADFAGKLFHGIVQCAADGGIFGKIQHYRRDWIRSARV